MNKRAIILLLLLAPFCPSCTTYYQNRFPVLERPERPRLADVPAAEMTKMGEQARHDVAGNFNSLIDYARKLEVAIDEYNVFATRKNRQFREGGP